MRLDFLIANATTLSRKEAKRAISGGRVLCNSEPCRQASTTITSEDTVTLDGEAVTLPSSRYIMLNKPAGVISATTDSQQPTALDLLPPDVRQGLHIAGRLDRDTTGLLLLTTDGQWSHRITSPRSDCHKRYRLGIAQPLSAEARERLEAGVMLKDESKPTKPATVVIRSEKEIELTLAEGRYHQVKRMLAAVGNHVEWLHRFRIGSIELDPDLAPGESRSLSADEINSVY